MLAQHHGSPSSGVSEKAASPLLRVEHFFVEYRGAGLSTYSILNDVSFQIRQGETVGVLGESGCGKSTLARALLGILPPGLAVSDGVITLGADQLLGASEKTLRGIRGNTISLIHQEAEGALHPLMRVREQVAEIFRAHRPWNRRKCLLEAQTTLQEVFGQEADRMGRSYPHELSGGQRQRVLIAQAIACRPELVIADEPTASLDLTTQAEIIGLLAGLKKRHQMSLLLISHNPRVLRDLADRVIVMYAGKIVESGSARIIFSRPLHPYTHALLRLTERSVADGWGKKSRLATIPGAAPVATSNLQETRCACAYEPRCDRRLTECQSISPSIKAVNTDQEVRCLLYAD